MQPLSGNQRPDLLTALMNMSLVLHLPQKMHLCRSPSNAPRLPSFLEMPQNPHILLTFDKVHNPLRLPRETSSERPKVVRMWCVLYILTSKCASRHNGVHFFISHGPAGSAPAALASLLFDPPEPQIIGKKHLTFGALLEVEMSKKCTLLWREAHFEVKMYKAHHSRTTFGSWDVEKVHAVVARSTFASEKAKNTSNSEHFWKLRCRKSARRCGEKHICKWKS